MASESQHQSPNTKLKVLDIILSILQMSSFTAAFVILLYFRISTQSSQNSEYLCSYREVILVSAGLFIKMVRMLPIKKVARKIALSQIKFYTPYLLTIMQCVFKYFSQPHQHATEVPINLFLIFLIIKNIYYSFLTHQKLTSFIQALVASLTLVAWVTLGVYSLMTSVYQFDNQVDNDYKKDLVLLFLTTLIANGAMMMDLIFRPVEELIKEKEEEEEKEEQQKQKQKQSEEKEHLNKKKDKECPHCNQELPQDDKKSPQNKHQHTKNRSQTQSPFHATITQNQGYRKSALGQTKEYKRYSINEEFSRDSSRQKSIHGEDTGREIELNLIDKQEEPRKSKLY